MAQRSASSVHRLLIKYGRPDPPVELGNVRDPFRDVDQTLGLALNGKPGFRGQEAPRELCGGKIGDCAHFVAHFVFQLQSERAPHGFEDGLFGVATTT